MILKALFEQGQTVAHSTATWQWSYGTYLRIEGLQLDPVVEVHFSLAERGGNTITRIGTTKDNVTYVEIPKEILENEGVTQDYNGYAFIYQADKEQGATTHEIITKFTTRPQPETFEDSANDEAFKDIIEQLNKLNTEKVTSPLTGKVGQVLAVKAVDESGKPTEYEAVNQKGGGGGTGTTDYNDLSNKPSVNDVELKGNKTSEELGLLTKKDLPTVPTKVSELENDLKYQTEEQVKELIKQSGGVESPDSGNNDKTNEFSGLKAVFLGDSQTEANFHKKKIWWEWVRDILNLGECINYGQSGSCITNNGGSSMSLRYKNMPADADLVFVMGGVNDVWFSQPLGQKGDSTDKTFYGAVKVLCENLLKKYPKQPIIFITPTLENNPKCVHSEGIEVISFANAMIEVCHDMGVLCLDAFSSIGVNPYFRTTFTSDGLHLNDLGGQLLGSWVAKQVKDNAIIINDGVIPPPPVSRVTLNRTDLTINEGDDFQLVETVLPEDTIDKRVTWSSSVQEIATVEKGKVHGVKAGVSDIKVTTVEGGKTATCKVTVAKKVDVQKPLVGKTLTVTGLADSNKFTMTLFKNMDSEFVEFAKGKNLEYGITLGTSRELTVKRVSAIWAVKQKGDFAKGYRSIVIWENFPKYQNTEGILNVYTPKLLIKDCIVQNVLEGYNYLSMEVPLDLQIGESVTIQDYYMRIDGIEQNIDDIGSRFVEETYTLT